jgi:type II secretory ATPase GspE/PulE/Tfp pilus assembly ATPase PilB-like protein
MNVKAIAIISLAIILIMAGIGVGCYWAGSKAGYEEAQKEYAIAVADVTEKARLDQEKRNATHLKQVAQYEKRKQAESSKIQSLRQKLEAIESNQASNPVCDDTSSDSLDIIRLLNEAISNPALPKSSDIPFPPREKESTASYLLFSIAEYNKCAIQLNTLIDEIEPYR